MPRTTLLSRLLLCTRSVVEYYNYLTKRWQEYLFYRSIAFIPEITPQATAYLQTQQEHDQIYQFLMGLGKKFEIPRYQILAMISLPQLTEIFALVEQHEHRLRLLTSASFVITVPTISPSQPADQVAFAATYGPRFSCSATGKSIKHWH